MEKKNIFFWGRKLIRIKLNPLKDKLQLSKRNEPKVNIKILESHNINENAWTRDLELSINRQHNRNLQNISEDDIWKRELGQSSNRRLNHKHNNRRKLQNIGEDNVWKRELNQSNNRHLINHENLRRQLQNKRKADVWARELNQSSNRQHNHKRKSKNLRRELTEAKLDKEFWTQVYESNNDHKK